MEQDERGVPDPDPPEGKEKEQGGDASAPGGVAGAEGGGLARGAASSEQEGVSRAGDDGRLAAAYEQENVEATFSSEALTEEELEGVAPSRSSNAGPGDAPVSGRNEDPATIRFELRGFRPARRAIAHATPPSSYRRLPLRSRKQYGPTRLVFAGDAASGIGNAHDPGTSEAASVPRRTASLGPTSARSAGVSAAANAGHGGAKNEAMVSAAARRSDDRESNDVEAAAAAARASSSSCRHPSRSRKQRRPDRCISNTDEEDSGAAARAKARRGNIVLDRFLAYLARTPPEQRPEWVRNVTAADDVGVEGQRERGSNVPTTASAGGPEVPPDADGSARILAVVAVLGASLALSLVSCVLLYIVGQRTADGLPDTHQKK